MGRPVDYSALPSHQAVSEHYRKENKYGYCTVVADVTCPGCGKVRSFPLYTLRQQMQRPGFDGKCKTCGSQTSRANARETLRRKYVGHRRVVAQGYVAINSSAVAQEDRALFDAMRGKGSFVFEHRMVFAKHLGRPLRRDECIDHQDGNKQNNALHNLRLYVMKRNDPGNTPGHGTYYHEWQMALARIKELESK
jgi:hypothetical protein